MTIIGIDLGTTFSAASVVIDSKPQMIPLGSGHLMPSVVGIAPDGKWLVGTPALNQWTLYPERTIRSIKRKMGSDDKIIISQKNEAYRPEQISALILQKIKRDAQAYLNQDITQAVITVPAYFSDAQRRATRLAGELAGLDIMRIINEPTAAALAYGLTEESDEIALIYDLGGGTFDVSLVEMSGGIVDVRASHGDTELGGDDFDARLADWLTEQFEEKHNIDLQDNRRAQARIRQAAENAKIELSTEAYAWVREEYLVEKDGVPLHMEIEVSRPQFEDLISDLLDKTLNSVNRVLEDAEIDQPDHIMLVGGSTYIPAVREMLTDYLGVTPRHDVNPSEAVALGAGIQGAIIEGVDIDAILVDVTPFSLGIAIAEFLPMGYVAGDRFKILVPRNTPIPVTQKEVFSAMHPDQTSVKIEVYQGERLIASENTLLGEFIFENLKPETPGEPPKVVVQFDLDINGILKVEAADRGSKQSTGITVRAEHHKVSQRDLSSEPLPDVEYQPFDVLEAPEEISSALRREADVLLSRAYQLDPDALKNEIDTVEIALSKNDAEALQAALEDLSDALFDLEA